MIILPQVHIVEIFTILFLLLMLFKVIKEQHAINP